MVIQAKAPNIINPREGGVFMIFAELFVEVVPCAYDTTGAVGTSTYMSWTSDHDA